MNKKNIWELITESLTRKSEHAKFALFDLNSIEYRIMIFWNASLESWMLIIDALNLNN